MSDTAPPIDKSTHVEFKIDNNLADLLLMAARLFEKLPPAETRKLEQMISCNRVCKPTAKTVAAMCMSGGFVFAMQLRELQEKREKGFADAGQHAETD